MKNYILLTLLLCLSFNVQAAFPVVHNKVEHAAVVPTDHKTLPMIKIGPCTKVSAYSFLFVLTSYLVLFAISGFAAESIGATWLLMAHYISGLSVIAAILGNILNEGRYARIMLFLSVFFFLLLLIFL